MNIAQQFHRLRPFVWGLAILALVGLVIYQVGPWGRTATTADWEQRPAAGGIEPGVDLYPLGERLPAPPLQGTTLDGDPLALSDLAGDVVVLNVWGSWCAPCRAETPALVRVAGERADDGVSFVGINTRDNPSAAKAFVRSFNVPYPSMEDAEGLLLLAFRDTIPTSVVPTTVVIDRQGRIAARIIGPVTYNTLNGLLDDVAAERGGR